MAIGSARRAASAVSLALVAVGALPGCAASKPPTVLTGRLVDCRDRSVEARLLLTEWVEPTGKDPVKQPTLDSTSSGMDGRFTVRSSPRELSASSRRAGVADLEVHASDGTRSWAFGFTVHADPDGADHWLDAPRPIKLRPLDC